MNRLDKILHFRFHIRKSMPENDSFGESQVVFMVLGQKYVTYVNDGHLLDPIGEVEDMLLVVTHLFIASLCKHPLSI